MLSAWFAPFNKALYGQINAARQNGEVSPHERAFQSFHDMPACSDDKQMRPCEGTVADPTGMAMGIESNGPGECGDQACS